VFPKSSSIYSPIPSKTAAFRFSQLNSPLRNGVASDAAANVTMQTLQYSHTLVTDSTSTGLAPVWEVTRFVAQSGLLSEWRKSEDFLYIWRSEAILRHQGYREAGAPTTVEVYSICWF